VNTEIEKYIDICHENGPQALPRLSLLQHAEWATAAAALPHQNNVPLILGVNIAKGIRELPPLLLRRDRATLSSTTLDFKANA
jgi:hypothetical protein